MSTGAWSWVIGGLSVAASLLLANRQPAGWAVALVANITMGGYGAATGQPGFVAAEAVFVATNVYGWSRWRTAPDATAPETTLAAPLSAETPGVRVPGPSNRPRGRQRAAQRRPLAELLAPYRPAPFARHNARR